MKLQTNDILNLLDSFEKHFKKDISKLKTYVLENNYCIEENNDSFKFTGYTEIHDFFRLCVDFKELENLRFDFYKIEIKEDKLIFFDYYDKILFEKPIEQCCDLKNVPYKALAKFFKD